MLERAVAEPTGSDTRHRCGAVLFQAGDSGEAWRLCEGIVRLDQIDGDGIASFAGLAIAGDILGCETLLLGAYTFRATALTPCRVEPWPGGGLPPAEQSLLATLAQAQRRAADMIRLRGGQAMARVRAAIRLLANGHDTVVLPTQTQLAEITDLRFETISRLLKQLERAGQILPIRIDGVHAGRSFWVPTQPGH